MPAPSQFHGTDEEAMALLAACTTNQYPMLVHDQWFINMALFLRRYALTFWLDDMVGD